MDDLGVPLFLGAPPAWTNLINWGFWARRQSSAMTGKRPRADMEPTALIDAGCFFFVMYQDHLWLGNLQAGLRGLVVLGCTHLLRRKWCRFASHVHCSGNTINIWIATSKKMFCVLFQFGLVIDGTWSVGLLSLTVTFMNMRSHVERWYSAPFQSCKRASDRNHVSISISWGDFSTQTCTAIAVFKEQTEKMRITLKAFKKLSTAVHG